MVALSPQSWLARVPKNYRWAAGATLCTALFMVVAWDLFGDAPRQRRQFAINNVPALDNACHDFSTAQHAAAQADPIPNIVHYVWLLKDPAVFELSFTVFVSVYSAHLFWQPEAIYLHSDASDEVFEHARLHGSVWTQRILAIPGFVHNRVTAPTVSNSGVEIGHFASRSDFVRIEAIRDFGGVYIDTDVVPLRDIRPLRESGFATVLSGQYGSHMYYAGFINNGIILGRKGSLLMYLWLAAAHKYWDGTYATVLHVLSDLAQRLVPLPSREVLVVHERAFLPVSWETDGQTSLWKPLLNPETTLVRPEDLFEQTRQHHYQDSHEEGEGEGEEDDDDNMCYDVATWLGRIDAEMRATDNKLIDMSGSYTLHAFDSMTHKIWGWDGVVDLKYVLRRESNYARAVYPAISAAIEAGVIPREETIL